MNSIARILFSSTLLASVMAFNGCTKLENKNYGSLTPGSFPKTEAELKASVVAAYYAIPEGYIDGFWNNRPGYILSELPTDEMNTGFGSPWSVWDRFQWQPNNTNSFDVPFRAYSKGVTDATIAIGYAKQSSLSTKDYYIAELRALRGFLAFQLYDMFGPVPLITDEAETTPSPAYTPVRPSKADFVSFIEGELKAAAPVLKTKADLPAADWGHLDRGAALTILLKLYLKEKRWADVVSTATLIEGLGYDLYANYLDIFNIANEGKGNKEAIFVLSRFVDAASSRWSSTWNAYFLPADPKIAKWEDGTAVPANALTTIYGGLRVPWKMYDKFEASDNRRKGLMRYYYAATGPLIDYRAQTNAKATGAAITKFGMDPAQTGEKQGNDFVFYRFADVLLAKAEALNELNGLNQASINLVNRVNQRAFNTPAKYTLASFASQSAFRDFMLDERFRELYLEGHRRQDLIRYDKLVLKGVEDGWAAEAKHVVFPIPTAVTDQFPTIVQNDGY